MSVRSASAVWEGGLREGNGKMAVGSGAFEGGYSFRSRFEDGEGTNPEELIGAAHAGCFSMAFANGLAEAGFTPKRISTTARVHFRPGEGPPIKQIALEAEGEVDGIDADEFQRQAEQAKEGCPVSQALAAVEITLEARLAGGS